MSLKKLFIIAFLLGKALNAQAPLITSFSWGKTIVSYKDQVTTYEDCKIYPTGCHEWDWKKTNTHHVPGIQIADVEDIATTADIIILTRGVDGVLQIKPETIQYLEDRGKSVITLKTRQAVKKYNSLVKKGKRVAIVLHSTC